MKFTEYQNEMLANLLLGLHIQCRFNLPRRDFLPPRMALTELVSSSVTSVSATFNAPAVRMLKGRFGLSNALLLAIAGARRPVSVGLPTGTFIPVKGLRAATAGLGCRLLWGRTDWVELACWSRLELLPWWDGRVRVIPVADVVRWRLLGFTSPPEEARAPGCRSNEPSLEERGTDEEHDSGVDDPLPFTDCGWKIKG